MQLYVGGLSDDTTEVDIEKALAGAYPLQLVKIIRDVEQAETTGIYKLIESAGVFAILRGLDRTSKSDWEIIGKAMIVMDSLYAELKDRSK